MLAASQYMLRRRCVTLPLLPQALSLSTMVQTRSKTARLSHQERTATEPRHDSLHTVVLKNVTAVNDRIRTYRFETKDKGSFNVPSILLAMTPYTR